MQSQMQSTPPSDQTDDTGTSAPFWRKWQAAWHGSLRFRLLALGLTPLLMAFPVVIGILVVIGGTLADRLLLSGVRGNLAGAHSYLNQVRTDAGVRIQQMVQSERMIQLLHNTSDRKELNQVLATAAKGSGLDYLIIANANGRIVGSSLSDTYAEHLPDSPAIRQAQIGIANAAFDLFSNEQLGGLSKHLAEQARLAIAASDETEGRALLINAAAHFPLVADTMDAILLGGILLNRNFAMIEHMREVIFPVGSLPEDIEGMSTIHLDNISIVASRQRLQAEQPIGSRAAADISEAVIRRGETWLGRQEIGDDRYILGYAPISNGDGRHIGMIAVGYPDTPYRKTLWLMLGMMTLLMALIMFALSLIFLRTGRQLTQRLALITATMNQVRQGNRSARSGNPLREDELGQLSRHFDMLLDTIEYQDEVRRATLQTVADEASRRRALFEHERDGVAIFNEDGSFFEANPKSTEMLGYSPEELMRLRMSDWDIRANPDEWQGMLHAVGPEGRIFETVHRRKDGSFYDAEVSFSRAAWGDKVFALFLLRDITKRKAVEQELERYRLELEARVEQRTRELTTRSEQLNAIFTLSPDGFVSFDNQRRVAFANQAFLNMVGVDADAMIGLHESEFSRHLAAQCLATARFPGVAALRAAREKVDAGGTAHDAVAARRHIVELAGPGGRVLEVGIRLSQTENVSQILFFSDITHESEVDRMKSEFLSTAAHELRTPMASIFGYSELLLAQDFDKEMRDDLLRTIFRQAELMSSIINELLDLARIEARRGKDFVIERLSLAESVASTVDGFKIPPDRAPPLIECCETPLFIKADRKKIGQAVLNILSNAYKYSPNGGSVDIRFLQRTEADSTWVGVEIRDHGIGMSPEQQSRVFERFYRADTSGKIPGTGLGMSIVREIVELHGGSIDIASAVGTGTRVTLWVPDA